MPIKRTITTPLGQFPTITAAAQAHHCDKAVISRRFRTDPENYQREDRIVAARPRPRFERTERGVRWPISWSQYRMQEYDVKEQIYQAWCDQHRQDPDTAQAAEAFFDEMDQYQTPEDLEEDDLDDAD